MKKKYSEKYCGVKLGMKRHKGKDLYDRKEERACVRIWCEIVPSESLLAYQRRVWKNFNHKLLLNFRNNSLVTEPLFSAFFSS